MAKWPEHATAQVSDVCFCPIADAAGTQKIGATNPLTLLTLKVVSVHNNGDLRLLEPEGSDGSMS